MSVESVTLLIRAIANDMIFTQAGEVLTDNANFMFPLLNDALNWFENECNNHGVDTFTKETFLNGLTPTPTPDDPATQVDVSDTGYYDGQANHAQPQLPTDLLNPIFLWERQSGSTEDFLPMQEVPDGLPSTTPCDRFRMWEWREDGLYMPGATQENNLRLRYKGSHAQLVTPNDTLYFRGATGPMAYKVASVYLMSKQPETAAQYASEAAGRLNQILTRNARMKQRESVSRIRYGSSGNSRNFIPPRNS